MPNAWSSPLQAVPPVRPGERSRHSQQNRVRGNPEKYVHSALHRILLDEKACRSDQLVRVATSPVIHQVAPTRRKVTPHWPGGAGTAEGALGDLAEPRKIGRASCRERV